MSQGLLKVCLGLENKEEGNRGGIRIRKIFLNIVTQYNSATSYLIDLMDVNANTYCDCYSCILLQL